MKWVRLNKTVDIDGTTIEYDRNERPYGSWTLQ